MYPIVFWPISIRFVQTWREGGRGAQGQHWHLWLDDKADLPSFPLFTSSYCQICFVYCENHLHWNFSHIFFCLDWGPCENKLNDTMVKKIILWAAWQILFYLYINLLLQLPSSRWHIFSSFNFPLNLVLCLLTSWFWGDKHKRWNDSPPSLPFSPISCFVLVTSWSYFFTNTKYNSPPGLRDFWVLCIQ